MLSQSLGKNGPAREKVVRRITRDLHTREILEDLLCDSQLQVPLHRQCLPLFPRLLGPVVPIPDVRPSRVPSGGGFRLPFKLGGGSAASFSFPGLGGGSAFFSKFEDTSVRSTLGTRTLSIMRQFIEDAEKEGEGESDTSVSELNVKEIHGVKDIRSNRNRDVSGREGPRIANKEAIKALRKLFEEFEEQLQYQHEISDDSTSEEEHEEELPQEMAVNSIAFSIDDEDEGLIHLKSRSYICVMTGFSQWRQ